MNDRPSLEQPVHTHDPFIAHMIASALAGDYVHLLQSQPLVVGVSGGPDSVALLHALVALRGERAHDTLHVAHFDHGLRKVEAEADKRHVVQIAERLNIPFSFASGDVTAYAAAHKLSLEDAARRTRYAFFANLVTKLGHEWAVAVAHTADDQAETVLMNLLRGTGLTGLAGMKPVGNMPAEGTERAPVHLLRPLLAFWRGDILNYLVTQDVMSRADASNDDPRFTRNRIRHQLLPLLARQYNSGIKTHLVTLARIVTQDDDLLDGLVAVAWNDVAVVGEGNTSITIEAGKFTMLHNALQLRLVRRAYSRLCGSTRDLDFGHAQRSVALLSAPHEGELHLPSGIIVEKNAHWTGVRLQQSTTPYRNALERYAHHWPLVQPGDIRVLRVGFPCLLDQGWRCEAEPIAPKSAHYNDYTAAFDLDLLAAEHLTIRTRVKGDMIQPLGMYGSKSLKRLYIDAKIPRVIRDRLAIVADPETDEVLWIPGPGGHRSVRAIITTYTRRALSLRFVNYAQEQPGV